jgi:SEC-C motif
MNAAANDPLVRFASIGKSLDPNLREELLGLGAEAVPGLLRFIENEDLWAEDAVGSGWPPIHAVELLGELKAAASVEPLLDALCKTAWDDIIHDRIVQDLPKLGAAVLGPALARITAETPQETRHALCCVLSELGVRDPRVDAELRRFFAEDQFLASFCLANYGDPAAVPLIAQAIEAFEPDFASSFGETVLASFVEAHERLGSPLPPALRKHVDELFAAFKEHSQGAVQPPRTPGKNVGRNDPCPCGSGLKFKKCCLDKEQPNTAPRTIHRGGQTFIASKGISASDLEAMDEFVEARRQGHGPAQQIANFAKPLLDAAQDEASLQNAMNLAMLFWNLAVCRDEATRAAMLDDAVKGKFKSTDEAREFRVLAADMLDRHRQLFPEMHRD